MPEPVPDRRRANGTRGTSRRDIGRDTKQKIQSLPEDTAVQDRIRNWQAQNVQEAVDLDAISVRSRPRSEAFCTPDLSRASSPITKEPQTTPRKRSTKWVQQDNKQWIKQRRSMRNSQGSGDPRKHDTTDIQNDMYDLRGEHNPSPSPCARTDSAHARNVTSSRAEREERRRRRREARTKASECNTIHQDQRSTPDASSRYGKEDRDLDRHYERDTVTALEHVQLHDNSRPNSGDSPQSMCRDSMDDGNEDVGSDAEDAQTYHPSKYARTLSQGINVSEVLQPPKGRKLSILNRTMGILGGRSDAPPAPSNRIPSIEAWLEEQPGPSFERDDRTIKSSDDSRPFKKQSRGKRVSVEPTINEVDDPNKIWESIATKDKKVSRPDKDVSNITSATPPSTRRLFSFEVPQDSNKNTHSAVASPSENVGHELQSPTNLHRQGAKSRRAKSYSIAEGPKTPEVRVTSSSQPQTLKNEASNGNSQVRRDSDHTPRPTRPSESSQARLDVRTDPVDAQKIALKRKLTHEDLISILSQPQVRKSTKSVRSVRKTRKVQEESILFDLLETMRNEEPKYNQELRTLVDGVTPVLLQSLLSKTDAAATLGLFSSDESQEVNYTKPIIQMGIALERLKALHGRIPLKENEIDGLLTWASSAQKHYQDYIKWYRLGFQGIMVNLAPLNGPRTAEEELMAQDLDGDVTNADLQKVDVAYLQKRPLVRLKKIARLISAVKDQHPNNEKASKLAGAYIDLTERAKQRHSEEQGRLEDEAAANIDVTRTRDIRTMAPTTSTQIDRRRKVRARDCFEMTLYHSTGQRMDCRIEIIIRDDPQPDGIGGDILICQIEENSKWLLFTPIALSNVSARRDESTLDIVLMIRGVAGITDNWHELLALKADVSDAVTEWVQMLGSSPLPPKICQAPILIEPKGVEQSLKDESKSAVPSQAPRTPLNAAALASLPSDIDVPIGEPSVLGRPTHKQGKANSASASAKTTTAVPVAPKLGLGGGLQRKEIPDLALRMKNGANSEKYAQQPRTIRPSGTEPAKSQASQFQSKKTVKIQEPLIPEGNGHRTAKELPLPRGATEKLHQSSDTFRPSHDLKIPQLTHSWRSHPVSPQPSDISSLRNEEKRSKTSPKTDRADSQESGHSPRYSIVNARNTVVDVLSASSLHSREGILRVQNSTPISSKASTSLTESIREQWAAVSGYNVKRQEALTQKEVALTTTGDIVPDGMTSDSSRRRHDIVSEQEIPPPPPPPHRDSFRPAAGSGISASTSSVFNGTNVEIHPYLQARIPQEHHSSSSASLTDSDDDYDTSDTSEDDYGSEIKDQATPLVDQIPASRRLSQVPPKALPSLPSSGADPTQPPDSALNSPYRQAPSPSANPTEKKRRTVAMVCSWSERGVWQPVHDEECSIVVSPGLVQAFKILKEQPHLMAGPDRNNNVSTPTDDQSPLVEFELTPIVPLRKGTALDITIRSPPTARSTIQTTNNVMFRSKTTQDCDKLYYAINWARCNNPRYAQLARSRAREPTLTFNPNAAATKTKSWFSFGSHQKSSYRASSQPPPSMADTGVSGSSSFSAFSALKRFGQNSPFSLKRSSIVRKSGASVTGDSLYSSSNGTGPGSGTSTPAPSQAGFVPGPDGPNVPPTSAEAVGGGGMVNNMKIHLFVRQGQKWEQLGQCHLTVLPAVRSGPEDVSSNEISIPGQRISQAPQSTTSIGPSAMANARMRHYRLPSSSHTPHKIHGDGREKRILITSVKNKEMVMLDETLGETCFEKIMQTGIAINVWREEEAVQDRGGVLTGRSRTYMVQFKTSMEASWVFNMCGVYRYGSAPTS